VASLGWVTLGAATEGVTLLFFPEKTGDFFAHRCHYHYRFLLLSLGCHPWRLSPHNFFYLSDLVSPLFFVNLPTIFFPSGVTPWSVSPGAVRPLPRHPSDATVAFCLGSETTSSNSTLDVCAPMGLVHWCLRSLGVTDGEDDVVTGLAFKDLIYKAETKISQGRGYFLLPKPRLFCIKANTKAKWDDCFTNAQCSKRGRIIWVKP